VRPGRPGPAQRDRLDAGQPGETAGDQIDEFLVGQWVVGKIAVGHPLM
jgi:hypothetical protein